MPAKELTVEMIEALREDLKVSAQPGGPMEGDAFRYSMFHQRLTAAEYGRPDAVVWALEWHAELEKEQAVTRAAEQQAVEEYAQRQAFDKSELAAGRASNPRYQAYLDTVEDLSNQLLNVGYMAFINERSGEYRRMYPDRCRGLAQAPGFAEKFTQFIREYADNHLSERVLRSLGQMKATSSMRM
jgi:hypothetical protein